MKAKPSTIRVSTFWALLVTAATCPFPFSAQASTPFRPTDRAAPMVLCDMPEIKGSFSAQDARYASRGTCVAMTGNKGANAPGYSQFDDYSSGKELFRADWTAEAGYNPTTKEAWERIIVPAPTTDERAPVGRPYGRFESKMICTTDPWLEFGSAKCTGISSTASGNLGELEQSLRKQSQPFTSRKKSLQTQALYDAHEKFVKQRAAMFSDSAPQAKAPRRSLTLPEIIEPRAGSTQAPQTPMKIRVAAPKNVNVRSYELQLESRQPNGSWKTLTNLRVSAAEVGGPLGYIGWGWHKPGTGPQMTAAAGTYRIRARTMDPDQGEAGEWREFAVAGEPGRQPDELRKSDMVTGAGLNRAAVGASPPAAKPFAEPTSRPVPLQGTPSTLGTSAKATLDSNTASPNAAASQFRSRSHP